MIRKGTQHPVRHSMVSLTYPQIQELAAPLSSFLSRRPVDIALTVPGELGFERLEVREIYEHEREDEPFFSHGNAPRSAIAAIYFQYRVKGTTEDHMVVTSELYFNPNLDFVVRDYDMESTPLHRYLKKALDEYLPTIRSMFDPEFQKDSAHHFAESIHEELVAHVFHPSRIEKWWEELD